MKFTSRITVQGIKGSKGQLESGQAYDSTKIYVQTDLDDSKGMGKGFATVEYNFGTSDEYHKFKHLPFPIDCDADLKLSPTARPRRRRSSACARWKSPSRSKGPEMDCRPCWYVQALDDGAFLAPDGEGGIVMVHLLAHAVPFETREAAVHAAVDHFDGQASLIQLYQPMTCEEFIQ